jgi:peptide-methionine (S)-S-oxide reductase
MADLQHATLGGGCFWCLEAVYQDVEGVDAVVSGYAGGRLPNPTYRQVCSGDTEHAEVVQVAYDPDEISYRDLLEIFFTIHDPTTKNRQGADVGPQYRSIILHHNAQQEATAQAVISELESQNVFSDPIVTEVKPLGTFYEAEAKHQNYYRNNTYMPYCQAVIAPKVKKLRQKHADKIAQ